MMKNYRKLVLFFFLFLTFFSFAQQVSTLQIRFLVRGKIIKKPVKNANVKVLVDDSLTRYLITDRKGNTGFLELKQGKHRITFNIDGFKPYTKKRIRVEKASGKRISIRLKRKSSIEEKNKEESPKVQPKKEAKAQ